MTLISWDEAPVLDVEEIDSQHRRLIALVNDLHQAMRSPQALDEVTRVLAELVDFTRLHFATEEALMTRHDYPGYEKHRKQHEALLADVASLLQRFQEGDVLIPFAIALDFKGWALRHIELSDRPLAAFLNQKGIH